MKRGLRRCSGWLAFVAIATAGIVPTGFAGVAELSVGNQELVSSSRVTRTHFDYVYRINIVNAGGPLTNVVAHVASRSPNTAIIEADVTLGNIAGSSTTTSTDTYTLRQDRTFPFNSNDLVWSFTANPPPNARPVADAGANREVSQTEAVSLSGSASRDADGDALSFAWSFVSRPADSAASLDGATSMEPHFVADRVGTYVLQLVVNDGKLDSAAASITVIATQKMVVVPDLVGLGAPSAEQALMKAGLAPGTVGNEPSTTVRMFSVIRHTPAAGQMVPFGSTVNYVYSGGGGWVNCPVSGAPLAARCTLQHGASRLDIVASFDLDDVLTFELSHDGVVQLRDQGLETFDLRTRSVTNDELLLAQYNAAARSVRLIFRDPTLFVSTSIISLDDVAAGPRLEEALILTAINSFRTRAIFYADFNLGGEMQDGSVTVRNDRTLIQINGNSAATLELGGLRPQSFQVGSAAELSAQISAEDFLPAPNGTIAPSPGQLGTLFGWDLMLPANETVLLGALTQIYIGREGTTPVPDVAGMARGDGVNLLQAGGFALGAEQTVAATGNDIGRILSQDPVAGTMVPRAFPVSIDVGSLLTAVVVPDIRTLPRGVAEHELNIRGLQAGSVTAVASAQTIGRVLSQNPVGGTVVQPGSRVALTTSLGLFVPNVNRLPLDQARATLEAAGYQVGSIAELPHPNLPTGTVTEQIPTAGSAATPGTAVNLRIAAAVIACPCTVPDLFDVPLAEARTLVERAGLTVGNISTEPGSGFGAGAVFFQSVDAGEVVNTNISIDLRVAADEGFVDCPNVGNVYTCTVSNGDSTFTYSLDLADSEELDYSLTVRGTRHITGQSYFLFDLDGEESEDVFLVPQYRPSTATVRIAEAEDSFRDVTTFDLNATDSGARLDVHTRFTSTDDEPVSGRVYAYTDFDLNNSPTDQSAFLKNGRFISVDGQTTGIVSVQPAAQSFQIGTLGAISGPLSAGQFLQLDPTATLLRNGNFEQAFSWDVVGLQPGTTFEISANAEIQIGRQIESPTINSAPVVEAREDAPYLYEVTASSQEYDAIRFELVTAPNGMSINSVTGAITWTPDNSHIGPNQCVVLARNSDGLTDAQAFVVDVENVNDAPSIQSQPRRYVRGDDVYLDTVVAIDSDPADSLAYVLTSAPTGMEIDSTTGEIRWTPSNQNGLFTVAVAVRDLFGGMASESWQIEVLAIPTTVAVLLDGEGTNNAIEATRTYFADGGISQGDFAQGATGGRIALNVLEVKVARNATVGQVNLALAEVRGGIVAMVEGLHWLTVTIPRAAGVEELEQVALALESNPAVDAVLPKTEPLPPDLPSGLPEASRFAVKNQLALRMPAAWNLRSQILPANVPTVAIVDWFGQGAPNESAFNVRISAASRVSTNPNRDPSTLQPLPCLLNGQRESHGYKMLGVTASPRPTALGAYQGPPLPVVLIDVIAGADKNNSCLYDYSPEKRVYRIIEDVLPLALPQASILNIEIQDRPAQFADRCSTDQECVSAGRDYLVDHLSPVDPSFEFTTVVAAGNYGLDARSTNNYAAAVASLDNGFVVENRAAGLRATQGIETYTPDAPVPSSNSGGNISAIGCCAINVLEDPKGGSIFLQPNGGTSAAAAQLTGVLAFLYALPQRDSSSVDAVNALVRRTAADLGDGRAKLVDPYATMLAFDETRTSAGWFAGSVREGLLNLADDESDGQPEFNVHDIEAFVAQRSQPYARADLNGGATGAAVAPYLDFNRFNLDRSSDGRTDVTSIGVNEFLTLEYDERLASDVQVLCYYVQLNPGLIYVGSPTEVDNILRQAGFPSCGGRLVRAEIHLNDSHPEFSGFPGNLTLNYDPDIDGESAGSFIGPCGPGGENGGPIWSSSVTRPAEFYATRASDVPADPTFFISSPGCSTFVALRNFLDTDAASGESLAEIWLAASEGRNRPLGTTREYQVRLYSGEPGKHESTRRGEFGVAGSLTNFSKIFDLVDWNYMLVFRSGEGQ